jgi:hypothetical protein
MKAAKGAEKSCVSVITFVHSEETYLARLSSTQQQHLDLVLGQHAVPFQLVLDLIVTYANTD